MKKNNCLRKFVYSLVFITVFSAIVIFVFSFYSETKIDFVSLMFGWLLSLANILVSIKYIIKAFDKDNKKFLTIVFGSMMIRLFLTLLFIVAALLVLKLDDYYFIFSLLFYYFVFLFLEILFINCRVKFKKTELNKV